MLQGLKVKLSLQVCESDRFRRFCGCNGKTSTVYVISDPDKVYHRCRAAIQQLTAPVVTKQFVLAPRYDVSITSQLAKNI